MNIGFLLTLAPSIIISIGFIVLGLIVFIKKKPLIISYRWFAIIYLAIFIPQIIRMFDMINRDPLMYILLMAMYIVLFGFLYYVMKGVMIFGANGEGFQKAFIETLQSLNLEFEQTFSSIKIKEPELELSIALQSWIGTGQIRMKKKTNEELFSTILHELRAKDIKSNLITPIFYILIGFLMLALTVVMLFR